VHGLAGLAVAQPFRARPIDAGHFSPDFVINEKTGGGPNGLPPGGVFLYVFEGTDAPDVGNPPAGLSGT